MESNLKEILEEASHLDFDNYHDLVEKCQHAADEVVCILEHGSMVQRFKLWVMVKIFLSI